MYNNSKLTDFRPTVHMNKNTVFRIKCDLTNERYRFDDPDAYKIDNIFDETIEKCMLDFQRFLCKCEYKVKFVQANGEEKSYFTNSYNYLYDSIDEQNELDVNLHEQEQRESSFHSVMKLTKISLDFLIRENYFLHNR